MTMKTTWLALIISLPTTNATARMRIWRALKSGGCGVLRDGVYLLPDNEDAALSLDRQAKEVTEAGGSAQIVKLVSTQVAQDSTFRMLFDRTNDYATLKQEADALLGSMSTKNLISSRRKLKRITREFSALYDIDFFPGPAREQTSLTIARVTAEFSAMSSPDEPQASLGKIRKLKQEDFRKRTWATRQHLWIDRMASAWLIKRFIDPAAKFKWLKKPHDCPQSALGFDFDGATFTHIGSLVTFEVLLGSFKLDTDPVLTRLAAVVHYLDVGGIPVAEAHGLELVLKGMRERCTNDDDLLSETNRIFDDLHATYTNEEKQHEQ